MWTFLREINEQGTTIILTTHYLEEAENLCRNIAIIDHGKIIEDTDMKSLLNRLDKETFIFDLKQPASSLNLDGFSFTQIDEMTVEVELNREQPLNHLFELFTQQGIEICSMKNKANRLEELFLNLVEPSEVSNND
jgi:ABC-2 type transport system ATP-binding protein